MLNAYLKTDMIPSNEMLNEWFKELSHVDEANELMWYWAGIAAYAHLSSAGSDEWKKQHGFKTGE